MKVNKPLKDISKHKAQNTPPNHIFSSCCFFISYRFEIKEKKKHIFSLKNINTKFKIWKVLYGAGWHSGNTLDMYSGSVRFESRPGQRLTWLRYSLFFIRPPEKFQDNTSFRPRPLPSKYFPFFHSCINIRRFIVSILKASLNNLRKKMNKRIGTLSVIYCHVLEWL
jgi:hypothetical protein